MAYLRAEPQLGTLTIRKPLETLLKQQRAAAGLGGKSYSMPCGQISSNATWVKLNTSYFEVIGKDRRHLRS